MDTNLIDEELYNFLKKFPKCANDLKEGIELLEKAVERTINTIEEKSGEIIIKERDFSKADEYRKKEGVLNMITLKLQDIMDNLNIEIELDEILTIEEKEEKEIPNNNEYLVDSNVQYTLFEDFTNKRPAAFELNGEKHNAREWKDMLLQTCNIISNHIIKAPIKIQNLDLYVSKNQSANSTRNIIIHILREYKIPVSAFKIYLRADYSEYDSNVAEK